MNVRTRKKLIEVALPLQAINDEGSHRKRKAPAGYPTTLHKWWAQRPVAAARAVIFAQLVDDPSAWPEEYRTEEQQDAARGKLFRIIEDLIKWDNTNDPTVFARAQEAIRSSWRRTCEENAGHPDAAELFSPDKIPAFHDPFAGSGALPLEAQRLGLDSHASDLNPVAVLINKAMIEIPPRFAGQPPVNRERDLHKRWKGVEGLAADVRFYSQWVRQEANKRIGHLYPEVLVDPAMAAERPDLKPYEGQRLTVIAWLWARTVNSPNPAFAEVPVPLASSFMLSTKPGKEAYVQPLVDGGGYRFTVKVGRPEHPEQTKLGTTAGKRSAFRCLLSNVPITYDYIRTEGKAGRLGTRLMGIVAEGNRGRVYLSPTPEQELIAHQAVSDWTPEMALPDNPRDFKTPNYGLATFGDLFTPRQLVALATISDLIGEAMPLILADARSVGLRDDGIALSHGGAGASAYAEAVSVYLAFALSRMADYGSSIATWRPKDSAMRSTMPKQAIQMAWDFAEGSPFGASSSGFSECAKVVARVIEIALGQGVGEATQINAQDLSTLASRVISTDPPYYDNIGYADLSDFFYIWLRRTLKSSYPSLFSTMAVPKAEELVATPYRHGSKERAEAFFLSGMTQAMHRLSDLSHPAFPATIYYAYKQSETEDDAGTNSTGWETFLDAVNRAGLSINGTWPIRTEGDNRQMSVGTNALASSIVLVCRPRQSDAPTATRREFIAALKVELPKALRLLQVGNIAPVDLAQAAIGPGMAVFTRYSRVIDAEGKPVSVSDAYALIVATLDEALAEQEGDFDANSRWALAWSEQNGFSEGDYGVAEILSKAKATSIEGLVEADILDSKRGKVRLLRPEEMKTNWKPSAKNRLCAWVVVHHLIRALTTGGERLAAILVREIGAEVEVARELAYRLYVMAERKKRAADALAYNGLVQSWPEIARLAREGTEDALPTDLFEIAER